jgi:hypothetical protein
LRASSATASAVMASARRAAARPATTWSCVMASEQQHLNERASAVALAVDLHGLGPPGVVDRGELAGRAGLFQSGRAGEGAGLADQDLQVVVQVQADGALGDQPLGCRATSTFWS